MSDQLRLELGQGVALRDVGTNSVLDRNHEWAERADRFLKTLAVSGYDFTAEDVSEEVGLPPHPNAMGGVFLRASKKGLIVPTGTVVRAERDARHASMLRVWRGRQK
jgi:hypothetical protein